METRIDSIIFRSCLVNSFQEARQLINHGFVSVNGSCVYYPHKKVNKSDIITIKFKSFDKDIFLKTLLTRSIPSYLELNLNNFSIALLWDTNFENTYYPVKEKYTDVSRYYK